MFGLNDRKKNKGKKHPQIARSLVTVTDAKSFISEQYRTIRTNIKFSMPDEDFKTILITSSTPGEGKSTTAANIGVVFAQEGKRVLIVDADMRKPTLHHTFNLRNNSGLSNVLARKNLFSEVIQETSLVGLSIITSGPIPHNPAELLSSKVMDAFLEQIQEHYDLIIFDAPPLLSMSDAQIISSKCAGTLLVVNAGEVKKEVALKARAILNTSHSKILGVVLNNYKMPRTKPY